MLIYFWVVLVISPAGFLEDLLGCSAICIISDSYNIVSILKCMCSQNKVILSFTCAETVCTTPFHFLYPGRKSPRQGAEFWDYVIMPSLWQCAVSVPRSIDFHPRPRWCRIPKKRGTTISE